MSKVAGMRPQLKRSLGRVEVFALSFGTMVGWGSIVLPMQWIESGGLLGAVISLLITTIMCVFVGLIYAELTSAFPLAGAELAFTYRSMGIFGSWFTGWMVCLAYIGIASFEGIALSLALNYLFPMPQWGYMGSLGGFDIYFSWAIVGISGALVLVILNIIGIRKVALFQILLLLVMIFTGAVFVLGAFAFGDVENAKPLITDMKGIEVILIMAPSMFIGFDMVAKSAEEINMSLREVPRNLILSISTAGIWYIIMTIAAYFFMGAIDESSSSETTASLAGIAFQSDIINKMIIIGGICGIITTWNGFIVGASRILFAMGRARMLPAVFGIVHPKYKTPVFAIVFVGVFCFMSPFLGPNAFTPFLNIVAFGTVITYFMVTISFILIRKKEPDLRREYRIKNGKFTWVTAIICMLFFLFWYTPLSPFESNWNYEWIFILIWMVIGVIFFSIFKASEHKNKMTALERENLIFGDEYSREL